MTLSISVVIVIINEGHLLRRCLAPLGFADEVLVADLGSADDGPAIARAAGATVLEVPRRPTVEEVLPAVVSQARHDWVLRLDPDEVFNPTLADELEPWLARDDIAIVRLPYMYYFRGRPLKTTIWGGQRPLTGVFHRERVILSDVIHRGISPQPGFEAVALDGPDLEPIAHHWADSVADLREKHRRYAAREGPSRLAAGERFSWSEAVTATFLALRKSLFWHDGWRGGLTGIGLSMFYAGYVWRSHLSLRRTQRSGAAGER